MTNIAFIVDGDLEKRFISQICKGSPIRKVGNGGTFPVKVIAKQVASHIRLLGNRYKHIILLIDRENRQENCETFSQMLYDESSKQADCSGLKIFIKDRMVEDWILADPTSIERLANSVVDTTGYNGNGGLKFLLKGFGINYNEKTTGVELLGYVNRNAAARNCPSLAHFRDNFPVDCWWLQRNGI